MNSIEEQFLLEVEGFRRWAATLVEEKLSGEWESDYPDWGNVYTAVSRLLEVVDAEDWSEEVLDRLLYITAADNESEFVASLIAKYPEKLIYASQAAIKSSYNAAKWQLAIELGTLTVHHAAAERVLLALARDEDEYTRRRALEALANIDSPLVNELIEPAWSSGHEYQRMMVLSALYKTASPQLEKYLALVEADGREYLVAWAERVRRGEIA